MHYFEYTILINIQGERYIMRSTCLTIQKCAQVNRESRGCMNVQFQRMHECTIQKCAQVKRIQKMHECTMYSVSMKGLLMATSSTSSFCRATRRGPRACRSFRNLAAKSAHKNSLRSAQIQPHTHELQSVHQQKVGTIRPKCSKPLFQCDCKACTSLC
jgi:hypothetical protein